VITVDNLTLKFNLGRFSTKDKKYFTALKNINLQINKGEYVGLIGRNGSGKSTLLRVISGIYHPTHGNIKTEGKIKPLLSLEIGSQGELTGLENIYYYSYLNGIDKKTLNKIITEVIDFAELGEFINYPLKNYSSGMKVRLFFSILCFTNPEVLLVDENIMAGDVKFRKKCLSKIIELMKNSSGIFASHSNELLREFCHKGLVLEKGEKYFFGEIDEALEKYKMLISN